LLETDVLIAGSTPTHKDAEAMTAAKLTRPKRPKKLKVGGEGLKPGTEIGVE